MTATAIRTKCLKCDMTIRAMDSDTWANAVTNRQVLRLATEFRLWWVHGRRTQTCPQGGSHDPVEPYGKEA
jgi:hypothetical protein